MISMSEKIVKLEDILKRRQTDMIEDCDDTDRDELANLGARVDEINHVLGLIRQLKKEE